jgi:pilus assembly protein Flp/PilA
LLKQEIQHMSKFVTRFVKNESGATAIEIIGAVTSLGSNLSTAFNTVSTKLVAAS